MSLVLIYLNVFRHSLNGRYRCYAHSKKQNAGFYETETGLANSRWVRWTQTECSRVTHQTDHLIDTQYYVSGLMTLRHQ